MTNLISEVTQGNEIMLSLGCTAMGRNTKYTPDLTAKSTQQSETYTQTFALQTLFCLFPYHVLQNAENGSYVPPQLSFV